MNLFWDFVKMKFKEFSVSYCISKARHNRNKQEDLETRLDNLDKSIAENSNNNDVKDERMQLKKELDELYAYRAKGYHIRSRSKWIEEGEKSSRYFLNMEKARQNYNFIDQLKAA